jgi:hypothetical protein
MEPNQIFKQRVEKQDINLNKRGVAMNSWRLAYKATVEWRGLKR